MDLTSLQPVESAVKVDILHPINRKPIGLAIWVHGSDSPKYRQAMISQSEKRMSVMRPGHNNVSVEAIEEDSMSLLVICTEKWEWHGDCTFNGDKPECTSGNVEKVYRTLPWVREQVDAAIANRSLFFMQASSN